MPRRNHQLTSIMFIAATSLFVLAGCEYDSPFQGENTIEDREAGMNEFNRHTGGVNQDPMIGGGQAGFDQ